MGFIHCCGSLRKSKSFKLKPSSNFLLCELDVLKVCPVCGHTVVQLTRIDFDNNISICRKTNSKAIKLLQKIKSQIIDEKISIPRFAYSSNFYLNYNEFGVKRKCYSNLSTLKLGLFENKNFK